LIERRKPKRERERERERRRRRMKEGEKWPTPAKTGKNAVWQDERDEDGRSDDRIAGAGRRIMTNHSRSEEKREKRKQRKREVKDER